MAMHRCDIYILQVAMGGMSNRWVVEAIKAQDWFQPRARQVCFESSVRACFVSVEHRLDLPAY